MTNTIVSDCFTSISWYNLKYFQNVDYLSIHRWPCSICIDYTQSNFKLIIWTDSSDQMRDFFFFWWDEFTRTVWHWLLLIIWISECFFFNKTCLFMNYDCSDYGNAAVAVYCNYTVCCGRVVTKQHVTCLGRLQMTCIWLFQPLLHIRLSMSHQILYS